MHSRVSLAIFLVLLGLLACVAFSMSKSWLRDFLTHVYAFGLLAMSLNLLIGYTGLISLGQAAFFALSAYVFAIAMQSGFSLPVAFLTALFCSGGTAFLVGLVCVRLSDIYFAFITLAVQMFLYSCIISWVPVTGGDQGLIGGVPRPPFLGIDLSSSHSLFVASTVLFAATIAILSALLSTTFGARLRAVRDNELRLEFLGGNVYRTKLACFVISAIAAGVGGVIIAAFVSGAYPNWAFWTTSGEALFMVVLGGTGTFLGPLVGTIILTVINDLTRVYSEHHGLVLGIIILIVALKLRKGVTDKALELFRSRTRE